MEQVRIGIINKTINMLDFLAADALGVYEREGLKVEFDTLAGQESVRALLAGDLDVIVSIGAAVRAIMQEQAPIKVALLVHRNAPHWLMVREGIKSATDLKGKLVQAAQPGSEPDVMVRKLLREHGLDPNKDVQLTYERAHPGWTESSPDPREDAVIARTLEQEILEARGFTTLLDLCERYPNTLIHGLVMLEKTLETRPAMVQGLVRAHRKVANRIDAASDDILDFIQQRWGVSTERAARAANSLRGRFVARMEPSDFGPVIESSAAALGKPPIAVETLLAKVDA